MLLKDTQRKSILWCNWMLPRAIQIYHKIEFSILKKDLQKRTAMSCSQQESANNQSKPEIVRQSGISDSQEESAGCVTL